VARRREPRSIKVRESLKREIIMLAIRDLVARIAIKGGGCRGCERQGDSLPNSIFIYIGF
jgi:hypothetical protein